jgi:recombinational DNA repair protein RecR
MSEIPDRMEEIRLQFAPAKSKINFCMMCGSIPVDKKGDCCDECANS